MYQALARLSAARVLRLRLLASVTRTMSALADSAAPPTTGGRKLEAFQFLKEALKNGKHVVAPMVDASELAWRLLCRRHGADICYTPMMHARNFATDPKYRAKEFSTCAEDRPLITQFCANDPHTILAAAKLVQNDCDAIDINLGCPQNIAKKGHYGAYLQDEWDLIASMVKILHENLDIPVTCKVRIFDDDDKTVQYAQMLEKAGCQLLTVHGRTREQRGQFTGLANWDIIKRVKESVNIPVFANGNVLHFPDVEACMKATGVQGVMSAEGNLYNPAIFEPKVHTVCDMVDEYLRICKDHSPKNSSMRLHLFKLFRRTFNIHTDLRVIMGKASGIEKCEEVARLVRERMEPIMDEQKDVPDEDKYWLAVALKRPVLERPSKEENGNKQKRKNTEAEAITNTVKKLKEATPQQGLTASS